MKIAALYPRLKHRLYFLHVPKCAGTSLNDLLDGIFVKEEIFPLHFEVPFLEQMAPSEVRPYAFYRGHLPYDLLMAKLGSPPIHLILMLRDPVTRLISNFEMRQRVPDPLDNLQPILSQMTFSEFLESTFYQDKFSNRATELLGGLKNGNRQQPLLEQALKRLEQADAVGLTERFEESLALLTWRFAWPPIRYTRRKNVSPGRERRQQLLNDDLKEHVRALEWADEQLYGVAQARFEQDWARFETYRTNEGKNWWRRRLLENIHLPESGASGVLYDLRRVYPGQGWYPGETHNRYGAIRWSGPESRSFVYFYVAPRQNLRFLVRIVGWLKPNVKKNWRMWVNGHEGQVVKRWPQEIGEIVEVAVKAEHLAEDGLQEIMLEVEETLSPAEMGSGTDERKLGLAYQWIAVFPA